MNNNILICFNNDEYYCRQVIVHLKECGIEVTKCADVEKIIINNLLTKKYNALIMFPSCDYDQKVKAISRIKRRFPEVSIAVFIYTSLYKYCREFINSGVERCILMPQNVRNACRCIIHMMNDQHLYCQEVFNFMIKYGFVPKVNGFYYFCSAIEICMENCPNSILDLYMEISKRFGVTLDIVESSIRHFIKISYNNGVISKLFENIDRKPSNSEMINWAVWAIEDSYEFFNNRQIIKKSVVSEFGTSIFLSKSQQEYHISAR